MPEPLLLPLFVVLSAFLTSINAAAISSGTTPLRRHQFREAPRFFNQPNCPSVHRPDKNVGDARADAATAESDPNCLCSDEAVHVAMTLDSAYLRGSLAAVHSILQHASCPENVHFHFIAAGGGAGVLDVAVSRSFPYLRFRVYSFGAAASAVSLLISASIRAALDSPLNYARNYLADILPHCVLRAVYLDSDLVLVDDIAKLAAAPLPGGAVVAAPEYCSANFTSYFTAAFWSNPVLSLTFAGRKACYFNTGVMVMDLRRWRAGGYTARIVEWMEVQKRMRIYELGSLPPFLLVFAGNVAPVDHRWNQHGLGGDNFRGLCRDLHAGPASLLHWSGKGKPWARLDANRPCPLDALWAPYDLLQTPFVLDPL